MSVSASVLFAGALAAAAVLGVPTIALVAALAGFVVVRLAATRRFGRATQGDAKWK